MIDVAKCSPTIDGFCAMFQAIRQKTSVLLYDNITERMAFD